MFCLFSLKMKAQDTQSVEIENARNADAFIILPDTAAFKPNSTRAVIYSAMFPGLGQIYNRKYWKLPLVYGAFIGCYYAINWNNSQYTSYKKAFVDFNAFTGGDETARFWKDYVPYSYPDIEEWTADQKSKFRSRLQSGKDYYRHYRDMSWVVTIGVYAICMIDAYVDAQLFDFDVSPDLSMRAAPVLFDKTPVNSRSLGLQMCFTF